MPRLGEPSGCVEGVLSDGLVELLPRVELRWQSLKREPLRPAQLDELPRFGLVCAHDACASARLEAATSLKKAEDFCI